MSACFAPAQISSWMDSMLQTPITRSPPHPHTPPPNKVTPPSLQHMEYLKRKHTHITFYMIWDLIHETLAQCMSVTRNKTGIHLVQTLNEAIHFIRRRVYRISLPGDETKYKPIPVSSYAIPVHVNKEVMSAYCTLVTCIQRLITRPHMRATGSTIRADPDRRCVSVYCPCNGGEAFAADGGAVSTSHDIACKLILILTKIHLHPVTEQC